MSPFELNAQQSFAAMSLRGHLSITAGAGSGKTRVLAERAANAVLSGRVPGWSPLALERVLAITFTDKAAGELAERIRSTLREAGESGLADDVDSAWISTIHGMCARILRATALEAGIDPAFTVLDTVEASRLRERAFDAAAMEMLEQQAHDRGLFAEYSYAEVAVAVRSLASELARNGLSVGDVAREPARDAHEICRDAINRLGDLETRIAASGAPDEVRAQHADTCASTLGRLDELVRSNMPGTELLEALRRVLSEHTIPRCYKGMKELRVEAVTVRDELLADCVASATQAYGEQLLELVDRYQRRLEQLKTDAGALDFDDLQRAVLDLFRRRPDVAERWGSAFDLCMVDEFQDTDEQQLQIVRALAGENLCTVGDALQSIYRFRGADVEVYSVHNQRMEALEATSVALSVNYRSHRQVLDFVNRLFGSLVGESLVHLEAGRLEPDPPVVQSVERVELLTCSRDFTSDEARAAIARRLAEKVAVLHREEGVPLGDIVLLVRTYTHADEYADALREAGVGALVVGGNRFLDLPEVGCLQAFCRLLGNAHDEEALSLALASPLCGMSDDGLLAIRRHADETSSPLRDAVHKAQLGPADALRLELFDSVRAEATGLIGVRPLGEILLRAFERSGWDLECLSRGTDGAQSYATVLKFARMADGFDGGQGRGPAAFSEYLDAKRRFGDHEAPPPVVARGMDAVRIMSVHASKGLEFPVVIVPELDAPRQADRRIARWTMRPQPRMGMRLSSASGKNRTTRWFDEIADENKDAEYAEYLRVFYVAFTRARDVLILAGQDVAPSNTSILRAIQRLNEPGGPDAGAHTIPTEVVAPLVEAPSPEGVTDAVEPDPREVRDWIETMREGTYRPYAAPAPPSRLSYSGFSSYGACPRRFKAQQLVGLAAMRTGGKGVSASSFGSAVHAAFEADITADEPERIDMLARYHRLDEHSLERLAAAITHYRTSDVYQRIGAWQGSVRKEAPFAIRLTADEGHSFILDGTIDLYARDRGEALVVDYKTGTSGSAEELLDRYGLQARCYALAALKDGTERVEVVFVRPEVVEAGRIQRVRYDFDRGDLRTIEEGLLGMFSEMCAGRYEARARRDELVCTDCPVSFDCPAVW